ncbi:MAG: hypothetical protein ACM3WP_01350 [Acidobacteriota bacterium]
MFVPAFLAKARQYLTVATSLFAMFTNLAGPLPAASENPHHRSTTTPIQHVIIIIGENRTFDHVFATYQPRHGQAISNLLSKGIVNPDGTPGPNFSLASQSSAVDSSSDGFQMSPSSNVTYPVLPPVLAGGYSTAPFPDVPTAKFFENGLPDDYYVYLTTGGTGLNHGDVDTRIPNATSLPSGPFQLTSVTHPYDTYDNSPVHRFTRCGSSSTVTQRTRAPGILGSPKWKRWTNVRSQDPGNGYPGVGCTLRPIETRESRNLPQAMASVVV